MQIAINQKKFFILLKLLTETNPADSNFRYVAFISAVWNVQSIPGVFLLLNVVIRFIVMSTSQMVRNTEPSGGVVRGNRQEYKGQLNRLFVYYGW